jgi:murein L,D-transpeptidase YcbB/YkuD
MNKVVSIARIISVIFPLFFVEVSNAENLSDQVSRLIGERIRASELSPKINCGDGLSCESVILPKFYTEREYRPAWSDDDGPIPYVKDLLKVIYTAYHEGLNPEDYHPGKIEALISELHERRIKGEPIDVVKLTDLDLMLTDAFLLYASHLFEGRVDHQNVYPDWVVNQRSTDLTAVLHCALESGEIESSLVDLEPSYKGYARL